MQRKKMELSEANIPKVHIKILLCKYFLIHKKDLNTPFSKYIRSFHVSIFQTSCNVVIMRKKKI